MEHLGIFVQFLYIVLEHNTIFIVFVEVEGNNWEHIYVSIGSYLSVCLLFKIPYAPCNVVLDGLSVFSVGGALHNFIFHFLKTPSCFGKGTRLCVSFLSLVKNCLLVFNKC